MRGKIVMLLTGVVLGTTGVASAASVGGYWSRTAPPYACDGLPSTVRCTIRGTPWGTAVVRSPKIGDFLVVTYSGKILFLCHRPDVPSTCVDAR